MSSTNDGEANFKRLASLPRTGTCVSVLAIVAAITAICISSTALWKLNYEHKKVRINDELWLQLKEVGLSVMRTDGWLFQIWSVYI